MSCERLDGRTVWAFGKVRTPQIVAGEPHRGDAGFHWTELHFSQHLGIAGVKLAKGSA